MNGSGTQRSFQWGMWVHGCTGRLALNWARKLRTNSVWVHLMRITMGLCSEGTNVGTIGAGKPRCKQGKNINVTLLYSVIVLSLSLLLSTKQPLLLFFLGLILLQRRSTIVGLLIHWLVIKVDHRTFVPLVLMLRVVSLATQIVVGKIFVKSPSKSLGLQLISVSIVSSNSILKRPDGVHGSFIPRTRGVGHVSLTNRLAKNILHFCRILRKIRGSSNIGMISRLLKRLCLVNGRKNGIVDVGRMHLVLAPGVLLIIGLHF